MPSFPFLNGGFYMKVSLWKYQLKYEFHQRLSPHQLILHPMRTETRYACWHRKHGQMRPPHYACTSGSRHPRPPNMLARRGRKLREKPTVFSEKTWKFDQQKHAKHGISPCSIRNFTKESCVYLWIDLVDQWIDLREMCQETRSVFLWLIMTVSDAKVEAAILGWKSQGPAWDYPIGSMVLVYMLTWLGYFDGKCYHI